MNKMKRIFSLVLAFSIVLGTFGAVVPAFAAEGETEVEEETKVETPVVETQPETTDEVLKEVPKDVIGTEHEASVRRLVAFGIVGGYPDGTYKPENAVNRAHFSKIIVEALGLADAVPAAQGQATGFKDVKGDHWAAGYINVASGNGLLKGFPDGTYRPAAQVTYAQALTMLVRALGYQDDFLQGTWPGNYVSKAADVGITAGVKIPSNATEGAKRGYIADLVNNALDAKVVKVETYKPGTSTVEYYETDIPLLKDKLEISKYEDTRIIGDKIVDDGLAKDEVRIKFLEDTDRYKKDRYSSGQIVKKDFAQGAEEEFRFENTVTPREIIGEEVTTYINDRDRLIYAERENDDVAKFDYVEKIKNGKVSLVAFDREYEFDTKENKDARSKYLAVAHVFNNKDDRFDTKTNMEELNKVENMKDLVGRMGKFVVRNNRIVYAEILDPQETPNYMVVLKNDNGLLEGVNAVNDEFKINLGEGKDYDKTLAFNTKGEKMDLKDIKEGNVIYAQEQKYDGDDIAYVTVVQDNKVEGEMGKVKADRVEIDSKTIKVVMYTGLDSDNKEKAKDYVTSYSIRGLDEVKKWDPVESSDWEDDMEDAYKEKIVAYKDGVGRVAFLTTESGDSGYKFGIVTRTYADSDRVRIYTTIDGKEGKDQIFKADKERDISSKTARMLDSKGQESKNEVKDSGQSLLGSAVKFRLDNDGEIAKDRFFVMPHTNILKMTDDFGKDIVKTDNGTFAVNSDNVTVIDGATAPLRAQLGVQGNLDGEVIDGLKVDIDEFNIATWKDIKEDKENKDVRFFIFPKTNKSQEADGFVFVGKEGANTGTDEEAIYVLDQWKKGDKLFVEYVKYPENKKETREVDNESRLALDEKEVKKEKAYVGKEKSNGKIELFGKLSNSAIKDPTKDFIVYRNVVITDKTGNYITVKVDGKDVEFLTTTSLIYEEDKSKTNSFLSKGMKVDVVSDGIRARVIGYIEKGAVGPEKPGTKGVVTYIDPSVVEVDGKVYTMAAGTVLRNEVGVIQYTGGTAIDGFLNNGDQVFDIIANADNRISSFKYRASAADRDAAKVVIDLINALPESEDSDFATKVTAARAAYDALTPQARKDLVTNLSKLEAAEERVSAVSDADGFKTAHNTILAKTVDTVVVGDKTAIDSALTAYELLSNDAKALLRDQKALLDSMKAKVDPLQDVADVATAKGNLAVGYAGVETANTVENDVTLTKTQDGADVSWKSSNVNIVANDGKVARPNGADVQITLTATITKGKAVDTKVFVITVKGQ